MTIDEADRKINDAWADYLRKNIILEKQILLDDGSASAGQVSISVANLGLDIDHRLTADTAMIFGHTGDVFFDFMTRAYSIMGFDHQIDSRLTINQGMLRETLANNFPEMSSLDYMQFFSLSKYGKLKIKDMPGLSQSTDINLISSGLISRAKSMTTDQLDFIATLNNTSDIDYTVLSALSQEIDLLRDNSISLYYRMDHRMKTFPMSFRSMDFISISEDYSELHAYIDQIKIKQYLRNEIATKINVAAQGAKIRKDGDDFIIDGFARNGEHLNIDDATGLIISSLSAEIKTVMLPMDTIPAEIDGISGLGLTSLLATGWSDYSDSSYARIKNIAAGFDNVGVRYIEPGDQFSFNDFLGPVTSSRGYIPELVILADKTAKELGGGLCQVSTTFYRAAMNAGLFITQRRNHGYMVSHYEPAGTDATIYLPAPNIKYKNDTGKPILVQGFMDDDDEYAYVNIYGTRTGRIVTYDGPYKSDFRKPPDDKIVYTTDLTPGKTKIKEYPIFGFRALFTRYVRYPSGIVQRDDVRSRYRPWGKVTLMGVTEEELVNIQNNNDSNASDPSGRRDPTTRF